MSLITEDGSWNWLDESTGQVSVHLDEDTVSDFESSDYKGFSGRSRLVRIGQDFEVIEYDTNTNCIYADVEKVNRTDGVEVGLKEGDKVGRFFAYNEEDILSGDELEETLRDASIEYEILNDRDIAIELDSGFLRPSVSGNLSMEELESVDKEELVEGYLGWDAGLLERRDHYVNSKPVKMPQNAHGIILGTENPEDEHYNSPFIDAGYGQDSADGEPIVFEMDYEAKHVNGHKPRPVMRLIKAE